MRIVKEAKTLDEAVDLALKELNTTIDKVAVEILEEGSNGFLGFGKTLFKVAVTLNEDVEMPGFDCDENEEEVYYGDDADFSGKDEAELDLVAERFMQSVLANFSGSFRVSAKHIAENDYSLEVNGNNCAVLIGRGGETLEAFNYLTNIVVNRKSQRKKYVHLDIADYKKRQNNILAQNARKMAHRVVKVGKTFEMKPMSSSERRVIHEALQDFEGVVTYSEGDGRNRRVIIAPDKNYRKKEKGNEKQGE